MADKRNVEEFIELSGLKKTFVADKLGVTPATLSRKIKEPSTFSGAQMSDLANVFGVSIIEIDFGVPFFKLELESNSSSNGNKIKQEAK